MQVRVVRIGGAYSGSRDPRQHGARARRERVPQARAVAARASDLRTPMVQHCQNFQPSREALERIIPVKNPSTPATPATPSTLHPKLGNVPTQIVHRMHAAFDCCTQAQHMSKDTGLRGEPGHSHGINGSTNTGAHGHTDHTEQPHNHPNPPTHPHARRPKPRPPPQPRSQCKPPCWYRKFRCPKAHAARKGSRKVDASERCNERSSRTMTRQKALMAL